MKEFLSWFIEYCGLMAIETPVIAVVLLGLVPFLREEHKERYIRAVSLTALIISFASLIIVALTQLPILMRGGMRAAQGEVKLEHHVVSIGFLLDGLGLSFALTTLALVAIVAFFSGRYLHRDPAMLRFSVLVLMFVEGMLWVFLGDNLPTIYIGWEIVGLTSVLLIAFHYYREAAVQHALYTFWNYKVGDAALLGATILWAHEAVVNKFTAIDPSEVLGGSAASISPGLLTLIWILVLVACWVKSAQFPVCTWLPKAMEGPTPSSAIFYGGLAVHVGLFVFLRLSGEVPLPDTVATLVIVGGLLSALVASLTGETQSDVKSALAYASIAQVGLMFVEVALGFRTLAVIHFIGHAFFRTYQVLNAASLLHAWRDAVEFESPLLPPRPNLEKIFPKRLRETVYLALFLRSVDDSLPTFLSWLKRLANQLEIVIGLAGRELRTRHPGLLRFYAYRVILVAVIVAVPLLATVTGHTELALVLLAPVLLALSLALLSRERIDTLAFRIFLFQLTQCVVVGLLVEKWEESVVLQLLSSSSGIILVSLSLHMIRRRFGAKRLRQMKGLLAPFPLAGWTALYGILILSAFPGTAGFLAEDVVLGLGVGSNGPVAVVLALSLAISGYALYRTYCGLFFGPSTASLDTELHLSTEEKVILVLANGLALTIGFMPLF